jgi:hypothetical protein
MAIDGVWFANWTLTELRLKVIIALSLIYELYSSLGPSVWFLASDPEVLVLGYQIF